MNSPAVHFRRRFDIPSARQILHFKETLNFERFLNDSSHSLERATKATPKDTPGELLSAEGEVFTAERRLILAVSFTRKW
jgi:hypothetical protein